MRRASFFPVPQSSNRCLKAFSSTQASYFLSPVPIEFSAPQDDAQPLRYAVAQGEKIRIPPFKLYSCDMKFAHFEVTNLNKL